MAMDGIHVEAFRLMNSPGSQSFRLFDLNEVIRTVVKLRCYTPGGGNIPVMFDLDVDLPQIRGDAKKVERMLLSLFEIADGPLREKNISNGKMIVRTMLRPYRIQFSIIADIPESFDMAVNERYCRERDVSVIECSKIVQAYGGELYLWRPGPSGWTFFIDLPVDDDACGTHVDPLVFNSSEIS